MALKNTLLISFAAITLFAAASEAYIVPGPRPDPYPAPGYPPPPPPPGNPGYPPQPGYPPNPGYPPGGGYDRQEQKTIWLGRRVADERLDLLRLAGIDRRYDGWEVESVSVQIRSTHPSGELSLLANGRVEDSVYSPGVNSLLRPRYALELGRDLRSLELFVRLNMQIDQITVNLRQRYQQPIRDLEVPVWVNRRFLSQDRFDLRNYIDLTPYQGYRIVSMTVSARAVYTNVFMDVLFNGFKQTPTLTFGAFMQDQFVYPQNAVIGQSAASIVFYNNGDIDVQKVVLRLSR